ncbi:MAG: lipid-binding SYLF domain-containing protein, partial [Rhodospirillaceae bacterium]|nr:lipid-binding SYLF domain-containing protein [Rhodospirillaceae bacterium]
MQRKIFSKLFKLIAPFIFSGIFVGALASCTTLSSATTEQKAVSIVNKSESVFFDFWSSNEKPMQQMRGLYPDARGIVILPGVLKGGFIVGAEGGSGVFLARDASGRWGYPAFYTMAAGSIGFQAGVQSSDIILLLFSDKAVRSLVRHQGK